MKEPLNAQDLKIVVDYFSAKFYEMVNSTSLSGAIDLKDALVLRKPKPNQADYSKQFIESCAREMDAVMKVVEGWPDKTFAEGFKVLMATIAEPFDSDKFFIFAGELINSPQASSRYWGLKICLTPNNIAKIKAGGNDVAALSGIISDKAATENSSFVIKSFSLFAQALNNSTSDRILLALAANRMTQYKSLQTTNEYCDAELLRALAKRIKAGNEQLKPLFAQIFAYAVQKYAVSLQEGNAIAESAKNELGALISETSNNILPVLAVDASPLLKAIERRNYDSLITEYNNLFGTSDKKGTLAEKLNFSYVGGNTPDTLNK